MQKGCRMLKMDKWQKRWFDELGLTTEQARDKAIEILESVRFNREELEDFMQPIDSNIVSVGDVTTGWIVDIVSREQDVRNFASNYEDGLAQAHNASSLFLYLDP